MAALALSATTIKQGTHFSSQPMYEAKDGGRPRFKVGRITLAATADDGDTTTIDTYDLFGISRILGVLGFIHTTADSVVVEEEPVTAYDSTSATLTVGGGTDNKKRFYVIYGL